MTTTSTDAIEESDVSQETQIQIDIIYAVIIPIIVVIGSALNLTTIIAFWKMPDLRDTPGELLILNLSVADLITMMGFLPLASPAYITPGYWPFGETGCRIISAIKETSIHGSLFALIAISVDRFLLVFLEYPKYIKLQSYRRIYVTIAFGWTVTMATVIIEEGIMWDLAKDLDETAASIPFDKLCLSPARRIRWYSLVLFLALFFGPVVTVCGLSIAFLYQLRKRLKISRGLTSSTRAAMRSNSQVRRK